MDDRKRLSRFVVLALVALHSVVGGSSQTSGITSAQESGESETYTDETWGYSISWDTDEWYQGGGVGTVPPDIELNTAASSENDFGSINFWGELGYGSDPESCLEAWTEERREFFEEGGSGQGISPFAEVERNTDPLRLANVTDGDGADVTVYLDFGEGKPKYIATYACMPLITGEAVLKVSTSAFVSEHEGVLRSAREVLATLRLPSIAGNAYTSPTWGYSLSWDANQWEADVAAEITDAGEDRLDHIVFENGTSTLTIEGSAKYEGDIAACLQRESDALAMTDGVSDFAPAAASGQTIGGQDEASAYGVYTFRLEAGTSRPINQVTYIDCRVLVPGEASITLVHKTSASDFNEQVPLVQEFIGTLDLPEQSAGLVDPRATVSSATEDADKPLADPRASPTPTD